MRNAEAERDLTPIEPENSYMGYAQNGDFTPANPGLEREPDEDRTNELERSLDVIWNNMDPSDPIFGRYPFTKEKWVWRPRRKRGRFVSPNDGSM